MTSFGRHRVKQRVPLLLAMVAAVLGTATGAPASTTRVAPEASDAHFSPFRATQDSAVAFFGFAGECIDTNVSIQVYEGMVQEPPGAPAPYSYAVVSLFQYDNCAGGNPLNAYSGEAPIPAEDFTLLRPLDSARLQTTVPLFDLVSSQTVPVTLDISWVGTGEITRDSNHRVLFDGQRRAISIGHSQVWTRAAAATGTISFLGTSFTSSVALPFAASLGWAQVGEVE